MKLIVSTLQGNKTLHIIRNIKKKNPKIYSRQGGDSGELIVCVQSESEGRRLMSQLEDSQTEEG